ncbi:MAG: DUF2326 domain-containing protein [Micrococcales bacterium]|nr:DUF2326 domain-containing protein [Micrococcales bacterium]
MFLHEIGSSDPRFKRLKFHDGMNVLLAAKTEESTAGESRNGSGKTSSVRILRYLLGGDLDKALSRDELKEHSFWADLALAADRVTRVERSTARPSRMRLGSSELSRDDWRYELRRQFGLGDDVSRPTVGQLVSQLVRVDFQDAVRLRQTEPIYESGIRVGYFLGFSPEILGKAGDIAVQEKHRKALSQAIRAGAVPGMALAENELRANLVHTKARWGRLADDLRRFRVDDQYADHQREADRLSSEIRDLNDEALALETRRRDIETAILEEPSGSSRTTPEHVQTLYQEIGLVLPDAVARRFDEVAAFHASVVHNRRLFLESELRDTVSRLDDIAERRISLDAERASVMTLLQDSMALDTFMSAQRDLAQLDAQVKDVERRLELAQSITSDGLKIKEMMLQAKASLITEIRERADYRDEAMALFTQLGEEIYNDRSVSLLIDASDKGELRVDPKIDGDASTGISEVKTFLLDIVCLITAIKTGRSPGLLVHDSLLFDSMDERQLASCLNIGARLADEHGFQYIVTLNSDRLEGAERTGFDPRDYVMSPVLTDAGEDGGLFGFRFV